MLTASDVAQAEQHGYWRGEPFIITYTGELFSYEKVDSKKVCIEDIGHSLAHLCRFTGHTSLFYSVAQHSLLVSEKMPGGPKEKLVGLLHDAAEAYTNDISSPLKAFMDMAGDATYLDLQNEIQAAVYNRFGVTDIPDDVRLYDSAAGVFEAQGIMKHTELELQALGFPTHVVDLWDPWDPKGFAEKQGDIDPSEIECDFIERFENLMIMCDREALIL